MKKSKHKKSPVAVILSKVRSDEIGGIETHQRHVREGLQAVGFEVIMIEPGPKSGKLSRLGRAIGLYALQRNAFKRSDILILNDPQLTLPAIISILNRSKTKICFSHGWIFHNQKAPFFRYIFIKWASLLTKGFNLVAFSSKNDSKLISCANGKVFGNPIKIGSLDGRKEKKNYAIVVGRDARNKNWPQTSEIIKVLIEKNILEGAYAVGQGLSKYFHDCPEVICDEHANDKQLNEYYSRSRFFISLSTYEGFGITLIEAMSYGCIPIVSEIEPYLEQNLQGCYIDTKKPFNDIVKEVSFVIRRNSDSNGKKYSDLTRKYAVSNYIEELLKASGASAMEGSNF